MKYSEVQYNATRMLLCNGDEPHAADVPIIRESYGLTGQVLCETCGAAMRLVDVLTIDRNPTWGVLSYDRGPPLYTTAKLSPLALMVGR